MDYLLTGSITLMIEIVHRRFKMSKLSLDDIVSILDDFWVGDFEEFIKGYEKEVLCMVNTLSGREDLISSITEVHYEGYNSEQLESRLYGTDSNNSLESAEKKIREYSEDLYKALYDISVP